MSGTPNPPADDLGESLFTSVYDLGVLSNPVYLNYDLGNAQTAIAAATGHVLKGEQLYNSEVGAELTLTVYNPTQSRIVTDQHISTETYVEIVFRNTHGNVRSWIRNGGPCRLPDPNTIAEEKRGRSIAVDTYTEEGVVIPYWTVDKTVLSQVNNSVYLEGVQNQKPILLPSTLITPATNLLFNTQFKAQRYPDANKTVTTVEKFYFDGWSVIAPAGSVVLTNTSAGAHLFCSGSVGAELSQYLRMSRSLEDKPIYFSFDVTNADTGVTIPAATLSLIRNRTVVASYPLTTPTTVPIGATRLTAYGTVPVWNSLPGDYVKVSLGLPTNGQLTITNMALETVWRNYQPVALDLTDLPPCYLRYQPLLLEVGDVLGIGALNSDYTGQITITLPQLDGELNPVVLDPANYFLTNLVNGVNYALNTVTLTPRENSKLATISAGSSTAIGSNGNPCLISTAINHLIEWSSEPSING